MVELSQKHTPKSIPKPSRTLRMLIIASRDENQRNQLIWEGLLALVKVCELNQAKWLREWLTLDYIDDNYMQDSSSRFR
jgi:hypothetical protein